MKALDHRLIFVGLLALGISGCTLAGASAAPLTPVGDLGEVVPSQTVVEQPEQLPTPTTTGPIEVFETQTAIAAEAAQPPTEEEPTEEPGGEILPEETEPTEEATEEPQETEEPAATQEPEAECPATHTVQTGENLYRIALRYGLTYQELASANGITNPDAIALGAVLTIPGCGGVSDGGQSGGTGSQGSGGETLHTVQAGENLFRISLQYGVSVQELAQYNGITNADAISVGQVIRIPASD
jgi:LysM repeat protein